MAKPVEILAICGSLRPDSVTHVALAVAAEGIEEAGGFVTWADPWVASLPLYAEDAEETAAVQDFKSAARRAKGFLWGSPEYHGTCSGVLKNALDHLTFDETEGKWVALVATSGGRSGASSTLNTLRVVARTLHLWVPPSQVSVPSSHGALDDRGAFREEEVAARLKGLGRELAAAVRAFDDAGLTRQD